MRPSLLISSVAAEHTTTDSGDRRRRERDDRYDVERRERGRRALEHQAAPAAGVVSDWDDAEVERPPICPQCGVTALPAETSNVIDSPFVCENPDCDGFGDVV